MSYFLRTLFPEGNLEELHLAQLLRHLSLIERLRPAQRTALDGPRERRRAGVRERRRIPLAAAGQLGNRYETVALVLATRRLIRSLRHSSRVLIPVVTVIALVVLFAAATGRLHVAVLLVGLSLAGIGSGLFMPSNATALMRDLPDERLGIANAMRLLLQSSGFVVVDEMLRRLGDVRQYEERGEGQSQEGLGQ